MRAEGHELHHITAIAAQVYNNESFDVSVKQVISIRSKSDDATEACASPDCELVDKAARSTEATTLKRKREAAPAAHHFEESDDNKAARSTEATTLKRRREAAPAAHHSEESDDNTIDDTLGNTDRAKYIDTPTKNQGAAVHAGSESDDKTIVDTSAKASAAKHIATPTRRYVPAPRRSSSNRSGFGKGKGKQITRRLVS
ncbi:50daa1ec-9a8e-4d32-8f8e-7954963416e4 [Thermothielavioides terrestris]|uniref:50daa1ec-9a8e-4d32-8f8e-7954963416e4 n=1 Tax=Thermothielavioides terrestris TaxID=2587410 RepID=A0A3S4B0Q1_9PEZI|nr:50daa1ec-9a8e-4d32-8f8e-7954963416e4 [Thermothielavioides terrestris]